MHGNHSQLDFIFLLLPCSDSQPPLIINIALGLPANMCVLWLILAGPGNKAAEILSLNQAICEVAISMGNVLLFIMINTTAPNAVSSTFFDWTIRFCMGFIFSGRPLFNACVCLDRYLAVVHPVTFLKYKLLRYKVVGTIISWLTVLVCCLIFQWVPYSAFYYVTFGMAFPWCLLLLFCCIETLRALKKPGPGEGNQESNRINTAKLKAFRIILFIVVTTAVCYLPHVIAVSLLGHISKEDNSKLFCIATYSFILTGFMPPILYLQRGGKLLNCVKCEVS